MTTVSFRLFKLRAQLIQYSVYAGAFVLLVYLALRLVLRWEPPTVIVMGRSVLFEH